MTLMDTEGEEVNHVTVIVPLLVAVLLAILVRRQLRQPDYNHIPTVGPSRFPFSYIGAFKCLFNLPRQLQDGHKQGHTTFKVADFARWNVVVTGAQLIEELRIAQKDQIAFTDTHDCTGLSRTDYGPSSGLSISLTRNLSLVIPEMRNEIVKALSDVISKASLSPDEDENASGWTAVLVADVLTEVVSRVCNRVIVGPQLCRSPELTLLSKEYIRYTWLRSTMLAIFPTPACTVLLKLFSGGVSWRFWRLRRALRTIIKERREKSLKQPQEETHDLLSSLISESHTNPNEIVNALLTLGLQATPSCTLNLTNALYHLAASTKSTVQTMRQEIGEAVRSDGWTTPALDRMVKVDSFLKETMRLNGLDALTMRRIAVVPHTFSDGTCIPQGTHLSVACTSTHLDASRYASPTTFDAFRFASETGPRYRLTTAAPDFLAWGLGRGACSGRFFAGAVMKLVLTHVVLSYDVQVSEEGLVQEVRWVGAKGVPNLEGKVLLKKRC